MLQSTERYLFVIKMKDMKQWTASRKIKWLETVKAARYASDPDNATAAAERRKDGPYPRLGGHGVTGVAVDLLDLRGSGSVGSLGLLDLLTGTHFGDVDR